MLLLVDYEYVQIKNYYRVLQYFRSVFWMCLFYWITYIDFESIYFYFIFSFIFAVLFWFERHSMYNFALLYSLRVEYICYGIVLIEISIDVAAISKYTYAICGMMKKKRENWEQHKGKWKLAKIRDMNKKIVCWSANRKKRNKIQGNENQEKISAM